MIKLTVLYGAPKDPAAFETYYANTHLPLAAKIGAIKTEYSLGLPGPGGAAPAFYRMAELYFDSAEAMGAAMSTPDGKAAGADIRNFATGGATMLVSQVQ